MKSSKRIAIFLGAPGSGKGSLAQLCAKRHSWAQLSTGNLCREHIQNNTDIGKQIDFFIKSGKLISDSLITDMVQDWLCAQSEHQQGIILDGFPRTVAQAEALASLLDTPALCDFSTVIIKLDVPDQVILDRVDSRWVCQNGRCQTVYSVRAGSGLEPVQTATCNDCSSALTKRSDDTVDVMRQRLVTYHVHEQALLDFYRSIKQPVHTLNGQRHLEHVYQELITVMDIS